MTKGANNTPKTRHSFGVDDCMRSDIVKDVIRAYGGN